MQNTKLHLLKVGRRFHVVAVGDNKRGPGKGYSRIPGQPNGGLTLPEAVEFARGVDMGTLGLEGMVGSYVSPTVRERLRAVPGAPVRERPENGGPPETAPQAHPVEGLIERRRAALRALLEIDREIDRLLGPEGAKVVARGLEAPTLH